MEMLIFKPLETESLIWPEADAVSFEALSYGLQREKVTLIELDLYINNSAFAASTIAHLLEMKKNQAYDWLRTIEG